MLYRVNAQLENYFLLGQPGSSPLGAAIGLQSAMQDTLDDFLSQFGDWLGGTEGWQDEQVGLTPEAPNLGNYVWSVPDNVKAGRYLLRVSSAHNESNKAVIDTPFFLRSSVEYTVALVSDGSLPVSNETQVCEPVSPSQLHWLFSTWWNAYQR
eukprot:1160994-Pelagomonas_calceolata.AAC.10